LYNTGGYVASPMRMRESFQRLAVLLLTSTILLASCGGGVGRNNSPISGGSASPQLPQFSHVVLVVEENHSFNQVIGNTSMPFLNQLANQNALATQYFADAHPSLPNYFMLTTGQLITLDDSFQGTVSDDNIVRELVASGKSWKSYAENLPSVGYVGVDVYPYARRHNPFTFLTDVIGTALANNLVPFSQFSTDLAAGQLPNFSFIEPNLQHDAHDCPDGTQKCSDNVKLGAADSWLQQNIAPLLSDANFQSSGLLIVVFDEGQNSDVDHVGGHVAMVMAGTGVKKGFQSNQPHEHAGILRLTLQVLGVQTFPGAASAAADMGEFF
jgi:phosphatidylinositol-3-phosphatase